jgi:hypothetical protein
MDPPLIFLAYCQLNSVQYHLHFVCTTIKFIGDNRIRFTCTYFPQWHNYDITAKARLKYYDFFKSSDITLSQLNYNKARIWRFSLWEPHITFLKFIWSHIFISK